MCVQGRGEKRLGTTHLAIVILFLVCMLMLLYSLGGKSWKNDDIVYEKISVGTSAVNKIHIGTALTSNANKVRKYFYWYRIYFKVKLKIFL